MSRSNIAFRLFAIMRYAMVGESLLNYSDPSAGEAEIQNILNTIARICRSPGRRLSLALPEITQGGNSVANFQLKNDQVATITITEQNPATGAFDPVNPADTFTLSVSDPSLNAVIGVDAAGTPAVVLNALKQAASGVTVTLSDSQGSHPFELTVDIVADVQPDNLGLDLADASYTSQPVPAS